MKLGEVVVSIHREYYNKSNFYQILMENKKVMYITHLRGRWIGPKANDFKKCQYGIYQSREPTCRDATKRGHIALETQDLSFCNTKTDGSN